MCHSSQITPGITNNITKALLHFQAAEHSVPLLTQLLEDRIGRMRSQLTHILSNNLTIAENTQLDQLYEDIHWLLLIAGMVRNFMFISMFLEFLSDYLFISL